MKINEITLVSAKFVFGSYVSKGGKHVFIALLYKTVSECLIVGCDSEFHFVDDIQDCLRFDLFFIQIVYVLLFIEIDDRIGHFENRETLSAELRSYASFPSDKIVDQFVVDEADRVGGYDDTESSAEICVKPGKIANAVLGKKFSSVYLIPHAVFDLHKDLRMF